MTCAAAMRQWKEMQRSFVEVVRVGTLPMIEAAVHARPEAVNEPVVRAYETIYAVVEAVKRGDSDIVRCLLRAGAQLTVQATERTGGCGMESTTSVSPLAEALVERRADIAAVLVEAHTDLAHDPGYHVTSTFEGNVSKTVLQLAEELHDDALTAAIRSKLQA